MKEDTQIRTAVFTEEFREFYANASKKVQAKIDYILHIIRTQYALNEKFIKKLQDTDFYEMRISVGFNEYRTILFSLNADNIIEATQVIFLNSFLKKDTKDYKKAINKAEKILEEFLNQTENE